MKFDEGLKKIVQSNVKTFSYLLRYFDSLPGTQYKFMAGVCKSGLNNNFFLLKSLEKIQFVAGDEETEQEEHRLLSASAGAEETLEGYMRGETPSPGDDLDIAELLKIWNTSDWPTINFKEIKENDGDRSND